MSALRYPTCPPQRHHSPPYLPITHCQGKLHTAPRHCASSRAPLEERFPCISRNLFSIHSPCSSFAIITLTGEVGDEDSRLRGLEGRGVFRVLVPTGGRRSDDDDSGNGPAAAAPCPNRAPACGGPEILGTTKILSGTGGYCGRWLVGKNQRLVVGGSLRLDTYPNPA